ncbi:hypothetical protein [Fusobacterium varium]|uniref:hypothetical protein n=1 Tax=Fusobacterium varium TaxID=856 RepID=UPI003F005809
MKSNIKTYKELKMKLMMNDLTFTKLVEYDGRSYTYLYREATSGNKKILEHLDSLIKKIINAREI